MKTNYEEAVTLLKNTQGLSAEGLNANMTALLIKTIEDTARTSRLHPNFAEDIRDFHRKFNQEYTEKARVLPTLIQNFRIKFLNEELKEYTDAVAEGKIIDQVDGLVDLIYVAVGTLYLMGVDINKVWQEVHNSNMSKTLVPKGEGKYGFTVHKGEDYVKPALHKYI
jgi:predicted HAD superfamily Cof-like phosphohydrolase